MKKTVIISAILLIICTTLISYCMYLDLTRVYELKAAPNKVYIDQLLLNRLPSNCYSFTNPSRVQDCQPHFIGEQDG